MTKEHFKQGNVKTLGMVAGNSQNGSRYFKRDHFHLIVGDLPYGIVHANSGNRKTVKGTRNPSELLESCVAEWYKVLKPGGVIVVAWNVFVASKQRLASILAEQGLEPLMDLPYQEFEHMVDKSIKRDILVAKKM